MTWSSQTANWRLHCRSRRGCADRGQWAGVTGDVIRTVLRGGRRPSGSDPESHGHRDRTCCTLCAQLMGGWSVTLTTSVCSEPTTVHLPRASSTGSAVCVLSLCTRRSQHLGYPFVGHWLLLRFQCLYTLDHNRRTCSDTGCHGCGTPGAHAKIPA